MIDQTIRLIYPSTMVNVPVIYQLIRSFDLVVNIVGAEIRGHQGWIEISLSGEEAVIREAISWLKAQGIQTIEVND